MNNMMGLMQRFQQFRNNFQGDPREQVQQLLKHHGYSRAIISSLKHDDRLQCNGKQIRTVDFLEKGDILLLAGKGHEQYMKINGEYVPFSEREHIEIFKRRRACK